MSKMEHGDEKPFPRWHGQVHADVPTQRAYRHPFRRTWPYSSTSHGTLTMPICARKQKIRDVSEQRMKLPVSVYQNTLDAKVVWNTVIIRIHFSICIQSPSCRSACISSSQEWTVTHLVFVLIRFKKRKKKNPQKSHYHMQVYFL